MSDFIFDIETGPLPIEEIVRVVGEFDPSEVDLSDLQDDGEFDPGKVKLGNTKQEDKVKAKIEEARKAWEIRRAKLPKLREERLAEARAEHEKSITEKAALNADTGRVLAIGIVDINSDEFEYFDNDDDEAEILRGFWQLWATSGRHIGFNIVDFDVPFLVRRSLILGVRVPPSLLTTNRYSTNSSIVDLLSMWRWGGRHEYIKLGRLARAMGVGDKTGSGADFAELWKSDREAALDYLESDVRLTRRVALHMGVLHSSGHEPPSPPLPGGSRPTTAVNSLVGDAVEEAFAPCTPEQQQRLVAQFQRLNFSREQAQSTIRLHGAERMAELTFTIIETAISNLASEPAPAASGTHLKAANPSLDDDAEEAIDLCDSLLTDCEDIPEAGEEFAASVSEKARSIRTWIASNGHVTSAQRDALENMQRGVNRWLERAYG